MYETDYDPLATPWLRSPDGQTLLPYIFGDFEIGGYNFSVKYTRTWLRMEDGDTIPLEWSFPPGGYKNGSPVVIILHGLNGDPSCCTLFYCINFHFHSENEGLFDKS